MSVWHTPPPAGGRILAGSLEGRMIAAIAKALRPGDDYGIAEDGSVLLSDGAVRKILMTLQVRELSRWQVEALWSAIRAEWDIR